MPDAFDVQDCLQRVRDGDPIAAEALIAHLHPWVWRWVRNHLPRRESEEDLVQDCFVKLFQKLDAYQERSGVPFEHWVSRLVVRTCLDALRAEKARPEWRWADFRPEETEWLDYLLNREAEVPTRSSAVDARRIVHELLARLSPPDRLVITLLDLEERSTQEIAELTGWTRAMVKMRAMRARHKLRALARQSMKSEFQDP